MLADLFAVAQTYSAPDRPRLVGIYFLLRDDELLYVGKSIDIDRRVAIHTGRRDAQHNRIVWVDVPVEDLDYAEGAFIRALNPSENTKANGDKARDAEILARFGMKPDPDDAFVLRIRKMRSAHAKRVWEDKRRWREYHAVRGIRRIKNSDVAHRFAARRWLWEAVKPRLKVSP